MKTNRQKKINLPKSGFNRSRFNWSHDVNTTFSWGEIQPTQCKLIQPNSKTMLSTQELIRLAPMVEPTFGRIKFKTFNQFVPIADLFGNYDAMMAQEPISTAFGTKVPQAMPSIILGRLCSYVLHGARVNIYWSIGNSNADRLANYNNGLFTTTYRDSSTVPPATSGAYTALLNSGVLSNYINGYVNLDSSLNTGYRVCLIPALMEQSSMKECYIDSIDATKSYDNPNKPSVIPLAPTTFDELFPIKRSVDVDANGYPARYREVTFDSADYTIDFSVKTSDNSVYYYSLLVELSDFGKRIRKVLQGCGYQIDFSSNNEVSLMPLFAQYKAYFDVFGLQLYHGWETTHCAKVLQSIDQCFIESISHNYPSNNPLVQDLPNLHNDYTFVNGNEFIRFMLDEIGNEWYTEDPDWIGSHIDKLAVSPQAEIGTSLATSKFISIDASGLTGPHLDVNQVVNADGTVPSMEQYSNYQLSNGANENSVLGFIDNIQHSQVDTDLLKRMYRWVNRNTLIGREIAKLLRAQGLGDYVDECKSNFIGSTDTMITISDVVSTADTNSGSGGAYLGEYGGKGLQYLENKMLIFENDTAGYWVTLATIVPESGYTQGLDPTLLCLKKFDLYNPDFDAIGMELTTKQVVCAARFMHPVSPAIALEGREGFGFTPQMSRFKVCQNLTNGDFNRHALRTKYLPFTLDKQLSYNDWVSAIEGYDENNKKNVVVVNRTNTLNKLAVAGDVWRTPTKFPWLGNFNRIFYNEGSDGNLTAQLSTLEGYLIGWESYNSDNFLSHAIYNLQCEAPMKPIENSYGLNEDINPTHGVITSSKA